MDELYDMLKAMHPCLDVQDVKDEGLLDEGRTKELVYAADSERCVSGRTSVVVAAGRAGSSSSASADPTTPVGMPTAGGNGSAARFGLMASADAANLLGQARG